MEPMENGRQEVASKDRNSYSKCWDTEATVRCPAAQRLRSKEQDDPIPGGEAPAPRLTDTLDRLMTQSTRQETGSHS